MKHKILFVDLDDTLLNDDKSVSARNCEAIRQMLAEGHYLVLATGSPPAAQALHSGGCGAGAV